jgi:acyl dehydratase
LISDKRPSASRLGEDVVTMQHTARNQRGEVVATAAAATLVRMARDE